MEDFQSKVLASDGVVENPQNKDQLRERTKYWHWKMTVSRKLFGKYGGPSEPSTGMGRGRYPGSSLANMENPQSKEMAWAESKQGTGMGRRYPRNSLANMTFRAKYWNGKKTVSQKLFGKYG